MSNEMTQTLIRCEPPFRKIQRFVRIFTVQDGTDFAVPLEICALSKSSRAAALPRGRKQWVRFLGLTCSLVSCRTQEEQFLLVKHGTALCRSGNELDSVHTPVGAPRSVRWKDALFGHWKRRLFFIPFVKLVASRERRWFP